MFKMVLDYCEDGGTYSDFEVVDRILSMYEEVKRNNEVRIFKVSTENIVQAARRAIVLKQVDWESIEFRYEGHILNHSSYGGISKWPNGFCDRVGGLVYDIIKGSVRRQMEDINITNEV